MVTAWFAADDLRFPLNSLYVSFCSDKYVSDAQKLHEQVLRLNHDTEENGTSINCMKISFGHEYPLCSVSDISKPVPGLLLKDSSASYFYSCFKLIFIHL
jgi:hypothetical protein